ncbi:MAG: thymidylate synthase (FAD), partial [Desulfurococcaceae archaeon]
MNAKGLPRVRLIYTIPEAEKIIASAAKATLSPREFAEIVNTTSEEFVEKWIRELIVRGHGSPL